MVHISNVVECSRLPNLVPLLLGNVQVSLATDNCLIESAQDLECVAQVPTGLGFPHAVANGPCQQQVMFVELQGPGILLQVEVGIAQLAVDGTQCLQVLSAHLHGSLKEGHTCLEVPRLA